MTFGIGDLLMFKRTAIAILVAGLAAGCGGAGNKEINAKLDTGPHPPTLEDYKAQLRGIVRDNIADTRRAADESSGEIYNYKPYYFKEFHDYPEGPDAFEIEFVEQDSKIAPLAADVYATKLRFTTDVQRDRNAVRTDMDFQRERGTETISYELRNGQWHRVASLFVASELSTMMGGEWVPREEEPRNDYDAFEDREGWFRRTLNRLRIGDDPGQPTQ